MKQIREEAAKIELGETHIYLGLQSTWTPYHDDFITTAYVN